MVVRSRINDSLILDEGGAIHSAIRHAQVARDSGRALSTYHSRGRLGHRLVDMREIVIDVRVHVRRDAFFTSHRVKQYVL